MADHVLVPARVHLNLGSTAIKISDYTLTVVLKNDSKYVKPINAQGTAAYSLCKGEGIVRETKIKATIIKTPDGKFDDDIKKLNKAWEEGKANDPSKYSKDILFSFATNDDKPFTHIQFKGFVDNVENSTNRETSLPEVVASFVVSDPSSFVIKK